MIYEYEAQYNSGNFVIGYQYKIITGYTSEDVYNLDCTSSTSDCTVDLGPKPIYSTYTIKADGVTDDSQALIDLLNVINIRGGGTIILPPNKVIGLNSGVGLYNNITIKSSGGQTVIKELGNASSLFTIIGKENITIENLIFDGDSSATTGILLQFNATSGLGNEKITIKKCEFKGFDTVLTDGDSTCIKAKFVNKLVINECKFTNSSLGIFMEGVNHTVSIKDNFFEELNDNPIRIYGYEPNEEATDNILITGNEMYVKRVTSYINDTQAPRFDDGRVNFPTDQPSKDERSNLTGISAINIAMTPLGASDLNHENVVVADNIAFGSDYGFYDGGSADLFSLKDIVRLKCYGNTARNSGDLGFAIERCHTGVVSNNTADRNNSCGISIFDSSNISVTGNVCSNNELVRDGAYTNNPYGGIRVEQNGHGVIVEGNFCNADSDVVRSYVNYLADNDSDYNTPSAATQRYGVVVKNQGGGVPFDVKVGNNHATGMLFGSVFNNVKSAQIVDTYSRNIPPTKGDYPLGARLRNNLISSSTAATKEWYVSQRIQLKVVEDVLNPTITTTIKVSTLNTSISDGGVDVTYKIYENNDLTTIQSGDIIGIMQDNYSIHWTTVTSVDTAASTISFQDVLTDTITVANQIQRTVVSLRWEAL